MAVDGTVDTVTRRPVERPGSCIIGQPGAKRTLCGQRTETVGVTWAKFVQAHIDGHGGRWCETCLAAWRGTETQKTQPEEEAMPRTYTDEERAHIGAEAKGRVIEQFYWSAPAIDDEVGGYWVMEFTDGTEMAVRLMAELI